MEQEHWVLSELEEGLSLLKKAHDLLLTQSNKGSNCGMWERVHGQNNCTNNKVHFFITFSIHPIKCVLKTRQVE